MEQRDFGMLVETGVIETVVLHDRGEGWEVWAFGESFPSSLSNRLKTSRGGPERTWSDLNRAHAWIRAQGWKGLIEIDMQAGPVADA